MKNWKMFLFDGIFALAIIFGLNACEQNFNSQKLISRGSQKIVNLPNLFNINK